MPNVKWLLTGAKEPSIKCIIKWLRLLIPDDFNRFRGAIVIGNSPGDMWIFGRGSVKKLVHVSDSCPRNICHQNWSAQPQNQTRLMFIEIKMNRIADKREQYQLQFRKSISTESSVLDSFLSTFFKPHSHRLRQINDYTTNRKRKGRLEYKNRKKSKQKKWTWILKSDL